MMPLPHRRVHDTSDASTIDILSTTDRRLIATNGRQQIDLKTRQHEQQDTCHGIEAWHACTAMLV